jgi:hypothetical protein
MDTLSYFLEGTTGLQIEHIMTWLLSQMLIAFPNNSEALGTASMLGPFFKIKHTFFGTLMKTEPGRYAIQMKQRYIQHST